jgi:hypothetical protein
VKIKRLKTLVAEAEIMDGLRIVVYKMGSETGKLVAAVGQSGLAKGVKAGSILCGHGLCGQDCRALLQDFSL